MVIVIWPIMGGKRLVMRGDSAVSANSFGRNQSGYPAVKRPKEVVKLAEGEHLKLRNGLLPRPVNDAVVKVAEHFERFVKRREWGRPFIAAVWKALAPGLRLRL